MTRGVFLIAGIFFGVVAVALLASVEIETENVDCGVAPVAAIRHDMPGCESEGRNQTLGAAAAGAVAALFLFGSRAARSWSEPIPPGADAGDGPPALDDAALAELRRYRRRAWVLTAAGIALFAAFLIAVTDLYDDAEELERVGVRVPGTVESVRGRGERGSVRVSFAYEGAARREIINLDAESPRYELGQPVTVIVDPDDPAHVTLPGETDQSELGVIAFVVLLVGGAGAVLIGVWSVVRSNRQRAVLLRFPWRTLPVRFAQISGPRGAVRAVLLVVTPDRPEGVVLTLVSTTRWRLPEAAETASSECHIAGPLPGYAVIRTAQSSKLLSARPPYWSRSERKWRRALEQPDSQNGVQGR